MTNNTIKCYPLTKENYLENVLDSKKYRFEDSFKILVRYTFRIKVLLFYFVNVPESRKCQFEDCFKIFVYDAFCVKCLLYYFVNVPESRNCQFEDSFKIFIYDTFRVKCFTISLSPVFPIQILNIIVYY